MVHALNRRLMQPGDSETRRTQKTMVVLVAMVGSLVTLVNALPLFVGGLDGMAYSYIASAVYLFVGSLIILARPRGIAMMSFILLLSVLIFPPIAQIQAGGFRSGMFALPWVIFAPIGAALVLEARHTIVQMTLCAVSIVLVVLAEPYARTIAPEISDWVLVSFNVSNLLTLALLLTMAALILLRRMDNFRERADDLLLNILPGSIAERLKASSETIADDYDCITVVFADLVEFTRLSAAAEPEKVVEMLNEIFSTFDVLAARHGLEKIKTIGDAYMAAAGLPEMRPDHTEVVAAFAVDALAAIRNHVGFRGQALQVRIGINRGPVVAGVIGRQKFSYDMWGDTVNVASRMMTTSLPNEIQVTAEVRETLDGRYSFRERPPQMVKGKGLMVAYILETSPEATLETSKVGGQEFA